MWSPGLWRHGAAHTLPLLAAAWAGPRPGPGWRSGARLPFGPRCRGGPGPRSPGVSCAEPDAGQGQGVLGARARGAGGREESLPGRAHPRAADPRPVAQRPAGGHGRGAPEAARSPAAGAQTGSAPSSLISLHNPVGRGRAGVGRWVPFYEREGSLSREEGLACGGWGGLSRDQVAYRSSVQSGELANAWEGPLLQTCPSFPCK